MKHLAVRNWDKFQHYKNRGPVWIKLYTELLDRPEWLALSEVARAQLVGCWMLAAKRGNVLPARTADLRVLIGAHSAVRLDELLAGGWLEYQEAAASKDASSRASGGDSRAASDCDSTSRASARSREGETETEGEAPPPAREASPQVTRFLGALSPSQRVSWQHVLAGWQQGLGYPGGRAADPADIDVGVMEYLAVVDEPQRDYSPRHVVQFVESARIRRVTQGPREGRGRAADESTAEQAMRVAATLESLAGGQAA